VTSLTSGLSAVRPLRAKVKPKDEAAYYSSLSLDKDVLSKFVVHLVIRNSAISYSLHVWNSYCRKLCGKGKLFIHIVRIISL